MSLSNKLLITGGSGFTGKHLIDHFSGLGYEVHALKSNVLDYSGLIQEIETLQPNYVIHLAAISYADFDAAADYYNVNVVGAVNLMEAVRKTAKNIKKVILASSAAVYGEQDVRLLHEDLFLNPISHYGASKLALEFVSRLYIPHFPVLVVRPFNYTGVGHSAQFLVPKIVEAYKTHQTNLSLGNLNVSREFNDVRDVVRIYEKLLVTENDLRVVNICSGRLIPLLEIIKYMNVISGCQMNVISDAKIVRANDVIEVGGDPSMLYQFFKCGFNYSIFQTLEWMYAA